MKEEGLSEETQKAARYVGKLRSALSLSLSKIQILKLFFFCYKDFSVFVVVVFFAIYIPFFF